jgi:hypothetical protein
LLVRCLHLFCLCLSFLFCDYWSDRLFAYDWVSMLKKWKSVFKIAKLIRDSRGSQGVPGGYIVVYLLWGQFGRLLLFERCCHAQPPKLRWWFLMDEIP